MATKKKTTTAKRTIAKPEEESVEVTQLKKLNDKEVVALKGKLLEVRRIGAHPIFVEIAKGDNVAQALAKADIPTSDTEIKVEGVKTGSTKWTALTLKSIVFPFAKIAVTTKVKGSY